MRIAVFLAFDFVLWSPHEDVQRVLAALKECQAWRSKINMNMDMDTLNERLVAEGRRGKTVSLLLKIHLSRGLLIEDWETV